MKTGRNELCPCGSGKKYKRCCLPNNAKADEKENLEKLYFITYLLNSEQSIKNCLEILAPDDNFGYMVCVGLLTRFLKLFKSLLKNLKDNDGTAVDILIRPFYETALTLEYILVKWGEDLIKEFVLTGAMRQRDLINFFRHSADFNEEIKKRDLKKRVCSLEKSITEDGFKVEDLPNQRIKSWHRTISYKQMAKSLGSEAEEMFTLVYSSGSISVHPSWAEVKKLHLKKDKNGKYVPNNSSVCRQFITSSLIVCISLTVCDLYSQRFKKPELSKYCQKLHKNFHEKFNPILISRHIIPSDRTL